MRLVNFDFLNRVPCADFEKDCISAERFLRHLKFLQGKEDDFMSKRRRKKRVNKVFVSRGGIRI